MRRLIAINSLTSVGFLRKNNEDLRIVIDVGANVGQTLVSIKKHYPEAEIHCFEPAVESFDRLREEAVLHKFVSCHNVALSDVAGDAMMRIDGTSTSNAIMIKSKHDKSKQGPLSVVATITADNFILQNDLAQICFLKIDTEGHDMNVLIGAFNALKDHRVRYVQVESSMSDGNRKHVSFSQFFSFFQALNYHLVGVFEQAYDRRSGELRRANLLFSSNSNIGLREWG